MEELQNKIEAILFASGKGVSEENLAIYCEEKPAKIKKALSGLAETYQKKESSLVIVKHSEKWKLTVRGKYTPYIEKIVSETELPRTILKTLALIAYKSPVLQSDIVNMRGQSAYDHVKELVKEKLVTKEESGRSFILKITDKFYNYFDVEGDEEIRDLFENLRKKQQKITELEIISIAEEQEILDKNKSKLGTLKVVDSDPNNSDHEEIFEEKIEPRRNEKTEEEKTEEANFLDDIDSRIGELSKRVETHELPKRNEEESEEEKTENTEEKNQNEPLEETENEENKPFEDSEENYL